MVPNTFIANADNAARRSTLHNTANPHTIQHGGRVRSFLGIPDYSEKETHMLDMSSRFNLMYHKGEPTRLVWSVCLPF